MLGTWGYVAPEYADNEKVDERVDVFSFGMVLLELLSGKLPFGDEDILAWVSIKLAMCVWNTPFIFFRFFFFFFLIYFC